MTDEVNELNGLEERLKSTYGGISGFRKGFTPILVARDDNGRIYALAMPGGNPYHMEGELVIKDGDNETRQGVLCSYYRSPSPSGGSRFYEIKTGNAVITCSLVPCADHEKLIPLEYTSSEVRRTIKPFPTKIALTKDERGRITEIIIGGKDGPFNSTGYIIKESREIRHLNDLSVL